MALLRTLWGCSSCSSSSYQLVIVIAIVVLFSTVLMARLAVTRHMDGLAATFAVKARSVDQWGSLFGKVGPDASSYLITPME